jgi:hypothetical protein
MALQSKLPPLESLLAYSERTKTLAMEDWTNGSSDGYAHVRARLTGWYGNWASDREAD